MKPGPRSVAAWPARLARLAVSAALACLAPGAGDAAIQALSTPAVPSALARTAALMAITSAGTRLVAVGERGIVLVSDTHGGGWRQAAVPTQTNLTAVQFVSTCEGWAVGHMGVVLHSRDCGLSWARQLDGQQAAELVLRQVTADAGATPRAIADAKRLVADGPDKPFLDLYFENASSGFVVGAFGLMFHTADGGATWQAWQGHLANPRALHLYGIRAVGSRLYVVGEQGLAFRSDDHGATFTRLTTPYNGTFFGAVATRSGALFAYGLGGKLFETVDGAIWRSVTTGSTATITAGLEIPEGTLVFVDQSGGLLASRDGGVTFDRRDVAAGAALTGVAAADGGRLFVTGMQGLLALSNPG